MVAGRVGGWRWEKRREGGRCRKQAVWLPGHQTQRWFRQGTAVKEGSEGTCDSEEQGLGYRTKVCSWLRQGSWEGEVWGGAVNAGRFERFRQSRPQEVPGELGKEWGLDTVNGGDPQVGAAAGQAQRRAPPPSWVECRLADAYLLFPGWLERPFHPTGQVWARCSLAACSGHRGLGQRMSVPAVCPPRGRPALRALGSRVSPGVGGGSEA